MMYGNIMEEYGTSLEVVCVTRVGLDPVPSAHELNTRTHEHFIYVLRACIT
jgi:hypothetical protein